MMQTEVFDKVVGILKPFVRAPEALEGVKPETSILGELKVNSARLVDVVLEMEDAFGIAISDDEADSVRSVGDAVSLVLRKQ
ncbi:MAG TPA: phosphopantetheine-binding protein [Vulgatibacter sp.]